MRPALPDQDAFDQFSANRAWVSIFLVHIQLVLETSFFVHPIAAGSISGYRITEHLAYGCEH